MGRAPSVFETVERILRNQDADERQRLMASVTDPKGLYDALMDRALG